MDEVVATVCGVSVHVCVCVVRVRVCVQHLPWLNLIKVGGGLL